ncbi:MAG: hypothetical protein ACOY40_14675 [Bacillota bacterium]
MREIYLEIEGRLEERMGEVKGEFRGGSVNIITAGEAAGRGDK